MDVTVTTLTVPEGPPVILSVKSKDTTRQFHLPRGSRTLHFPWGLSGELKLQILQETTPQETLVLDHYLELGSQEERMEIAGASLAISVLPAVSKRQDLDRQCRASDRDRDRKLLDDSGIADLISASLARLLKTRPDKPLEFLISDLQQSMHTTS